MRNIKLERSLDADEFWPVMAMVTVTGSQLAAPITEGMAQPQLEEVIQSWSEIAVLKVTPNVECHFGFMIENHAQFLNTPVETEDGKFGVHIGDSDSTFLVFAKDMKTKLTLELVDRVDINDQNYATLPLY